MLNVHKVLLLWHVVAPDLIEEASRNFAMDTKSTLLSKTDFIHYLTCPKSLWLLKHKPELYPQGEISAYEKKLAAEGYEVEKHVRAFLSTQPDALDYSFQSIFRTDRGLHAKVDVIRNNSDGTINIYEVKSSTSVKKDPGQDHVKDATFQKIAAQDTGMKIAHVFIVHLNNAYVRQGDIDPEKLLVFVDVTSEVAHAEAETRTEIVDALELLAQNEIDEGSCSCLTRNKSVHCDTFSYFNPDMPKLSIYDIPRISTAKLADFVSDDRFSLEKIGLDEVSARQSLVVASAHRHEPVVNRATLADFFSSVEYPIHFIDYETYGSAIPLVDGASPQTPIPFQYSLHIKRTPIDQELYHCEYLVEEAVMPLAMVKHMQKHVGETGSIVSWHAAFEKAQNKRMSVLFPEKADFLNGMTNRMLDLEDLFKDVYRPSEILLMLQGGKRSDEWTIGRRYQAMDGEAEISARH